MNFTNPVGQIAGFIVEPPPTPSRLLQQMTAVTNHDQSNCVLNLLFVPWSVHKITDYIEASIAMADLFCGSHFIPDIISIIEE